MVAVAGAVLALAHVYAVSPASAVRRAPNSHAVGDVGPLWGIRSPLLARLWDARPMRAWAGIEGVAHSHFDSKGLAIAAATLPRGGGEAPIDHRKERVRVTEAVKQFSDIHAEEQKRLTLARRMFADLPRLMHADADAYGDTLPERRPFWDKIAKHLLEVLKRGNVLQTWDSHLAESAEFNVEVSLVYQESEDIHAAAALQLMLISDAVSRKTFDDSVLEICRNTESRALRRSIKELARAANGELEIIGEFLGLEQYCDDDDFEAKKELALMFRQELVTSGALPRRWKRLLFLSTLRNFCTTESGDSAVQLAQSLLTMLPSLECTPQTLDWWEDALGRLHTPLQVQGAMSDAAMHLQAAIIQEFRDRLAKRRGQLDGDQDKDDAAADDGPK